MTHTYSISERNYSWGEFYETTIACEDYSLALIDPVGGYTEEIKKKFAVFEALDKATSLDEIREIVKPLTENEINWLNSPCLDGIVFSIGDPENKLLLEKEYVETYKYYTVKKIIKLSLFEICKKGFFQIVKLIFEEPLSKEQIEPSKFIADYHYNNCSCILENCLRIASQKGHLDIVKLILEKYPHTAVNEALAEASEKGHVEIVKLLVSYGAKPNVHEDFCIRYAARYGHTNVVQFLLQFQPPKKAVSEALDWAFRYGHAKVVKILIDSTELLNSRIYDYFKEACISGYTEIIKLLLIYKNPNEFSWNGAPLYGSTIEQFLRYCLDCTIQKGYIEITKLLLENGAKLSKEHLTLAVKNCHPKTIRFILQSGITIENMHEVFRDQIETAKIITECVLFSE